MAVKPGQELLTGHAAGQIAAMRGDLVPLVDWNDNPFAFASKLHSHMKEGLLHRAFSLFLLDKSNRLLLQQRAHSKITFPDCWTNTVCSHPLIESTFDIEAQPVQHTFDYVIKRVYAELGFDLAHELSGLPNGSEQQPVYFAGRVHYYAPSSAEWSEHELDYVYFVRLPITFEELFAAGPDRFAPRKDEVRALSFLDREKLDLLKSLSTLPAASWADPEAPPVSFDKPPESSPVTNPSLTPWFRLIYENGKLAQWWDEADRATQAVAQQSAQPLAREANGAMDSHGRLMTRVAPLESLRGGPETIVNFVSPTAASENDFTKEAVLARVDTSLLSPMSPLQNA